MKCAPVLEGDALDTLLEAVHCAVIDGKGGVSAKKLKKFLYRASFATVLDLEKVAKSMQFYSLSVALGALAKELVDQAAFEMKVVTQ